MDESILLLFGVFALLVSDAAAGLASRLARGLALAASALLVAKVLSLNSFDVFHCKHLRVDIYFIIRNYFSIYFCKLQDKFETFFKKSKLYGFPQKAIAHSDRLCRASTGVIGEV